MDRGEEVAGLGVAGGNAYGEPGSSNRQSWLQNAVAIISHAELVEACGFRSMTLN